MSNSRAVKIGPATLLPALAIVAFMVMLTIKPAYYLQSAQRGLALFATAVLPALFPFFFCSSVLTKMGAAGAVSKLGARPAGFLFNSPPEGAYVLVLSLLCGYPVGAATLSDLYGAGVLDTDAVKRIASFTSTSGPVFILGTVGSAIYGNPAVGVVVLTAHYLSALVCGLVFRGRGKRSDVRAMGQLNLPDSDNALAESISSATLAMLAVGGYIVLCNMLIDTLSLAGLESALSSLPGEAGGALTALIFGSVEMTRGAMSARALSCLPLSVAITAAAVSFGGLSVMLQSYAFLSRCKMGFGSLLARKLTQAAAAFAFAFVLALAIKG